MNEAPSRDAPRTVRWGILSTANIGRKAVGPAIVASTNGRLAAVASRRASRAEEVAGELGATRAYGSYEALLDDPAIDAVYVPLPNALHAEWSIRALRAGKHVLCEKPLAPTAAACLAMEAAADEAGRLLMEAFMYRFHPRTRAAVEAVRSGVVGRPRLVSATFAFRLRREDDIRLSKELAGGALLDVGCYAVDVSRRLLGEEPVEASAVATYAPSGVESELSGRLRFPSGAVASVACALTLPRFEEARVVGSEGRLELDRAFLPGPGPVELRVVRADGTSERRPIAGVDQYRLMVEAFADRVLGLEPDAPRSDAREAARTLAAVEALAASAREGGRPVPVEEVRPS